MSFFPDCSRNKNNHTMNTNISLIVGSPDFFMHGECKTRFNPFTGNSINEEGKGYSLIVNNIGYDEVRETYIIWK